MTKDHIVPKSKKGQDVMENFQTMCAICNNLKADSDLTLEQVAQLREIYRNPLKLPKKELNALAKEIRALASKSGSD